ncbi:uncharacterized protein B0H18DRAFT_120087 [Fomitopsis serialis]|uniref:uncharacterized protein n=1 Tax=Fomitopsis serialis TaxID=139415 RepID=UPI0020085BCD|nr:uncharacterized protein B0H18DRAFT_120087 [Neoantrodia serialis]KAH9930966.1 hypothetical protein B0H18DRAFT_120087 [Neoantrodia serialis]
MSRGTVRDTPPRTPCSFLLSALKSMPPRFCIHHLFLILLHSVFVFAETRTIDDTFGDSVTGEIPNYSSSDCWSQGPDCSGCFLQPDASKAYNGTWHDTSSNTCSGNDANDPFKAGHGVTFTFVGTSLAVFVIMVSQGPTTWPTNLSFSLDGETSYAAFPINLNGDSYEFDYHVPVFDNSLLNNSLHTFTMAAQQGTSGSTLLFDYATYNFDSEQSTSSKTGSDQTSTTSESLSTSSSTSATGTGTSSLNLSHHNAPAGAIAGG